MRFVRTISPAAPDARYSTVAIFLHWAVAALILAAWLLPHARELFPRAAGPAIINLHRSVGETVFALVLLRAAWRFISPPPSLPAGTTQFVRWSSHLVHGALYVLMLAVPVLGVLFTWAAGHNISFWGFAEIAPPAWINPDLHDAFRNLHELGANAIIWLVGLHVAAALVHHYLFKDGLMDRILPARRRSSARGRDAMI